MSDEVIKKTIAEEYKFGFETKIGTLLSFLVTQVPGTVDEINLSPGVNKVALKVSVSIPAQPQGREYEEQISSLFEPQPSHIMNPIFEFDKSNSRSLAQIVSVVPP